MRLIVLGLSAILLLSTTINANCMIWDLKFWWKFQISVVTPISLIAAQGMRLCGFDVCLPVHCQLTLCLPISVPTAEINDMKISYVLLDGSNATSDIFYFTVQDQGRDIFIFHSLRKHIKQGTLLENHLLWSFLSVLPACCQSPKCLHHKDLEHLAMTDTQNKAVMSFHPTGKRSRFKHRGQRGLRPNPYYGSAKVKKMWLWHPLSFSVNEQWLPIL